MLTKCPVTLLLLRLFSPNRELVAIGAANIAASFVTGTLPGCKGDFPKIMRPPC